MCSRCRLFSCIASLSESNRNSFCAWMLLPCAVGCSSPFEIEDPGASTALLSHASEETCEACDLGDSCVVPSEVLLTCAKIIAARSNHIKQLHCRVRFEDASIDSPACAYDVLGCSGASWVPWISTDNIAFIPSVDTSCKDTIERY